MKFDGVAYVSVSKTLRNISHFKNLLDVPFLTLIFYSPKLNYFKLKYNKNCPFIDFLTNILSVLLFVLYLMENKVTSVVA